MTYKILCTGNPGVPGIAKCLNELIPNITFISRESGYDLSTKKGLDKFQQLVSEYNVFINHSQLVTGSQCALLNCVKNSWEQGHVINIGSVLEFDKWSWIDPEVAEEKRQLRDLSLTLSSEKFKTTHIIVGGLQSTSIDTMRLDPNNVAKTIKWILESNFYIPLIYVDHISDQLTKQWLSKKDLLK